jgi:dTDP-4-dehydrorhamnose reductase
VTDWVVTGAAGMLGRDLLAALSAEEVVGLDHEALDIADSDAVTRVLTELRPRIVVNAAAYTRVDDAETDELTAQRINGDGPGVLARWCAAHGARLVQVSTDYVFPGDATTPYDVASATGPAGAYGRTKLAGELAVSTACGDAHVVRTGWLYGEHGPSFIRTVGGRLRAGDLVDVVDDQRGAPTWTRDLATRLAALGTAEVPPGVWHCTAAGEATWFDVAVALCELLECDPAQVRPISSAAMRRPAPRPAYSLLSNEKWRDAGLPPMPNWRDALAEALATTSGVL